MKEKMRIDFVKQKDVFVMVILVIIMNGLWSYESKSIQV